MGKFSLFRRPNPDATIIKLLKNLDANVDPEKVIAELEKHPDYPSMLAVSDVLTAFNIDNSAYRLEFDELTHMDFPFIAHVRKDRGDFVLVKNIKNGNFYLANDEWDNHAISPEEFRKMFSGVVLSLEAPAGQGSVGFKQLLADVRRPAIIAMVLAMVIFSLIWHSNYFSIISWQSILLTVAKTAGLLTSVLLLIQSIDSNNPLVQVLCQTKGKTNCNAILSSGAAKVFEGLSWSEVGFFYFGGTWLLLLFGGNSPVIWQTITLLNFVSLPYTVYSIYYQVRIAKQWCVLCCTVQVLLWVEFIAIMLRGHLSFGASSIGAGDLSAIFICLLAPMALWLALKPLFLKLQLLQPLKDQLRKFKYNADLFNKMLTEQPKYALPDESWSIVLGNAEAEHIITMVSNPYCPPCSKTHKLLDELLVDRADIQARIVFTANNDEKDRKTPVTRHLMALNDTADKAVVKQALHDWYEQKQKSYEAWAKIYPVDILESGFYKIDRQHDWCQMAEVSGTPTVLLNGYRLPDLYQLPDLKYMLQ